MSGVDYPYDMNKKCNDDLKKAIGARVKELRLLRKLTIEGLAEKSNLNASYLAAVERGRYCLSIASLDLVAQALQLPLYELLKTQPPGSETEELLEKMRIEASLLPTEQIDLLLAIAREMKSRKK